MTDEERQQILDEILAVFSNESLPEAEILKQLEDYPPELVKEVTEGILVLLVPEGDGGNASN